MAPLLASCAMRSPGLTRWECSHAPSRYGPRRPVTRPLEKGGGKDDSSNWKRRSLQCHRRRPQGVDDQEPVAPPTRSCSGSIGRQSLKHYRRLDRKEKRSVPSLAMLDNGVLLCAVNRDYIALRPKRLVHNVSLAGVGRAPFPRPALQRPPLHHHLQHWSRQPQEPWQISSHTSKHRTTHGGRTMPSSTRCKFGCLTSSRTST